MRIRQIKPEFWQDPYTGQLPEAYQLAFLGLWSAADDWGRLNGDPVFLKSILFPWKPKFQMEACLNEFSEHGKLFRWEEKGYQYALIINFGRHQRFEKRGLPSITEPPRKELTEYLQAHDFLAFMIEDFYPTQDFVT